MKKYPNVTQKVILRHKGKILILKHKNGTYDFPGGRVEWGESLFESLNRELIEEINFKLATQPRLFHVWSNITSDNKRHSIMIYYITTLKKISDIKSNEGPEILWLTLKEMKNVVRDHDYVNRMFSWQDKQTPHSLFYGE